MNDLDLLGVIVARTPIANGEGLPEARTSLLHLPDVAMHQTESPQAFGEDGLGLADDSILLHRR